MNCNFDSNKCSLTCNKYPICSFFAIQAQLSEIQSQFNFIYKTLGDVLKSNEESNIKIDLLEEAFHEIAEKLKNDSETKKI
jgi:hypothetical protein